MTMRPSASVLPISTVRPPYCVMTSQGRYAAPPTPFSASASRPVTLTGTASSRQAASTASTTAEPLMSVFMASMPSAGLMSRPPVSKVIPLPTRTTRGVFAVAPAGA